MGRMSGLDTSIGGGMGEMPSTRWGEFLDLEPGTEAWKAFVNAWMSRCWKPIYRYIRIGWAKGNDDAKDLTQEFMTLLLEKGYLEALSPAKGSFRGYVRTALRHFLSNQARDGSRLKRGGGAAPLSLDQAREQGQEPADETRAEAEFDDEWRGTLLAEAIAALGRRLSEQGRTRVYEVFQAYYVVAEGAEPPRYADLASRLGMTETEVRHALEAARKDLRRALRDEVRRTVRSESEADEEFRRLFGG